MPMDKRLYVAVKEGDIKVLHEYKDQFATQLTPYNKTVLHVAASYFRYWAWKDNVIEFVAMAGMELLFSLNSNGETCIHIAVRHGQLKFIEACINYMKSCGGHGIIDIELGGVKKVRDLLRIANNYGNTALHEVMLMISPDTNIIELLVQEDADFKHPPNKAGKSPLYLAVEGHPESCAELILNNCSSPSYAGPYGTTALHAVASFKNASLLWIGCMEMMLRKEPSLTKQADDFGWNPLHLAAYLGVGRRLVRTLLMADKSMAYATTNEENKTPLQLAAVNDKQDVMAEILEQCPDTGEAVTSQGQTVLHLLTNAQGYGKVREHHYEKVLRDYLWNAVDHRDLDGNRPFGVGWEGQKSVLSHPWLKEFNDRHNSRWKELSALDQKLNERTDVWKERANTHLIVATLIVTVSFAAGFTVPGGYNDKDGMAILWKKAAFQTFAVADTIAMISSTAAVFLLYLATYGKEHKRFKKLKRYEAAGTFVMVAMVAMMIAFMTGLYAVLPSHRLALFICVICSLSLTFFLCCLGPTIHESCLEARMKPREEEF